MTDGLDGTELEIEHAVDAGGEGGRKADVAIGTEATHGVDHHGTCFFIPILADGGPVPALVVGGRVGPVEELEHLDGEAERDGVLDAVLHLVEGGELKEVGILGADIILGRKGVGKGEVLIPAEVARDFLAAEGIEGGGAEGDGGEFEVHDTCLGIVGLVERGGKAETAAQRSRIGDTGGGGAVEIVVAVGGILAVVAALEVDIGGEAAAGVGLGVLVVAPRHLEITKFREGGTVARNALFGDAVADVEITFIFIPYIIITLGLSSPTEVGVELAGEGKVDIIVDGPVVAAVLEVVAAVVHPAVAGHENA